MKENGDGVYLRLGLLPGATPQEVASAYRRLAHQAYPDARPEDPGAAHRFREITEAYQVLSDAQRRARYDLERWHRGRRKGAGMADLDPSVPVHGAPTDHRYPSAPR